MSEELQSILRHWGMEHISPVRVLETGAAIATGVWHLGKQYSLKTGNNFEGLRHHIHISRVLQQNGISASCPLVTLSGEDFVTCGKHYYVVTERVMDNFLSTAITLPEKDSFYFDRYARETRNMEKALSGGDTELQAVLNWASVQAANFAQKQGLPYISPNSSVPCARSSSEGISEGFICATKFRKPLKELLSELQASGREQALLHILALFIAWTGGQKRFEELIYGNLMAAFAVHLHVRSQDAAAR